MKIHLSLSIMIIILMMVTLTIPNINGQTNNEDGQTSNEDIDTSSTLIDPNVVFDNTVESAANTIPVTYSCCKNYENESKVFLDNFEDVNIWKSEGANGSYITSDIVNFKEGKQGLKFVTKNSSKTFATLHINKDFSNTKNFMFDVYVYDTTSIGYITVYFSSKLGWSKYFSYTIDRPFIEGWNNFIIKKSDFHKVGDEDWNNTMIFSRISVVPMVGTDTNVTFDNFKHDMPERPKVILTFDDGTDGDSNFVEPILTANGQAAVSFVPIKWLNNKEFMTTENLKRLQSAGWDISSHTVSHRDLTSLNDDDMKLELNNSYDWLVSNGFQKSAGFIAYPFGYFNENVVSKTMNRYIFARSTKPGLESHLAPNYEAYKLKVIEIHNDTTIQSVKDIINTTISQQGLSILTFHRVTDDGVSPAFFQYRKSDLKQISDYLKSRSSDIDVVTFSDDVNANINKFTPVINKTVRIDTSGNVELITKNKYDEYMSDMNITPFNESIYININKYQKDGISFSEYALNQQTDVKYLIGGLDPGQKYEAKIYWDNGTIFDNFYIIADSTGHIKYSTIVYNTSRFTDIAPLIDKGNIPEYKEDSIKTEKKNEGLSIPGFNNLDLIIILIVLIISKKISADRK